jgi:hypothetical protein
MNSTARPCHGTAVGPWPFTGETRVQSQVSPCVTWRSEWLWNWFLSDYFGVLSVSFILLSQTLYMIIAIVRVVK